MNPLTEAAAAIQPQLVEIRRHLHAHPELSGQEEQTAAFVAERLRKLGLEPQIQVGGTHGLYADIPGPQPYVGLRADMDALPITEENTVDYVSRNPGAMHACGHDVHTAMLLGAAELLHQRRDELNRGVRLIFQPHEELEPGGAKPMIEAGVLADVEQVYGLHIWSQLPAGKLSTHVGSFMASPAELRIRVTGMGGHAASPHECCDPVVVAAEIILALQSVVSRGIAPSAAAVVSITQLSAGTANNVIPPHVDLTGTIRTFDEQTRARVDARVVALAEGIAAAHGASAEVEIHHGYPPLINDADAVAHARQAALLAGFSEADLIDSELQAGGEDFAYFAQHVPAAFLFLGGGNSEMEATFPHHHPRFNIDESAMQRGSALLAAICLSL
jgi:amidohydrolase